MSRDEIAREVVECAFERRAFERWNRLDCGWGDLIQRAYQAGDSPSPPRAWHPRSITEVHDSCLSPRLRANEEWMGDRVFVQKAPGFRFSTFGLTGLREATYVVEGEVGQGQSR